MSALNFQRALVIGFLVWALFMLAGCSTAGALTGLIGSKPDVTAQAGAENVKQTLGVNGKVDSSSKAETSVKDSTVGKVDSSNGKKTSASSITADTIKADKIEIRNSDGGEAVGYITLAGVVALIIIFGAMVFRVRRNEKGA